MSHTTYRRVIAQAFGLSPGEIWDASDYVGGRTRYAYYVAMSTGRIIAFIKATNNAKLQSNLRREAQATMLASSLGIPCKEVLYFPQASDMYIEEEGIGAIALQFLEPADWLFVRNKEELAALVESEINAIVQTAIKALTTYSGFALPAHMDTSVFRSRETADWRYRSGDHLARAWNESIVVVNSIGNIFPHHVGATRHRFRTLFQEGYDYGLHTTHTPGVEYLVHGDFDPYNIAMPRTDSYDDPRESLVLDFEEAGKTNYKELAQFCDASNFIGRCWPNPALQQELIRSLAQKLCQERTKEECQRFMRAVVIFSAFYLAKYAMDPKHAEHDMAVAVLTNLGDNLDVIDDAVR